MELNCSRMFKGTGSVGDNTSYLTSSKSPALYKFVALVVITIACHNQVNIKIIKHNAWIIS